MLDIYETLELNQNLVSHHLKALKDVGLVHSRRAGKKVMYRINDDSVWRLLSLFDRVFLDGKPEDQRKAFTSLLKAE